MLLTHFVYYVARKAFWSTFVPEKLLFALNLHTYTQKLHYSLAATVHLSFSLFLFLSNTCLDFLPDIKFSPSSSGFVLFFNVYSTMWVVELLNSFFASLANVDDVKQKIWCVLMFLIIFSLLLVSILRLTKKTTCSYLYVVVHYIYEIFYDTFYFTLSSYHKIIT